MSQLISRILLSIFMVPLMSLVYLVMYVKIERSNLFSYPFEPEKVQGAAGLITWVCVAAYWILIWHRTVRWDAAKIRHTFLTAIASAGIAVAVTIALMGPDERVASFVGAALMPTIWVIATVFVWRDTATDRAAALTAAGADTIVCPACGYNLTGIFEARCPECGIRYTLNELYAQQPSRTAAKNDRELAG